MRDKINRKRHTCSGAPACISLVFLYRLPGAAAVSVCRSDVVRFGEGVFTDGDRGPQELFSRKMTFFLQAAILSQNLGVSATKATITGVRWQEDCSPAAEIPSAGVLFHSLDGGVRLPTIRDAVRIRDRGRRRSSTRIGVKPPIPLMRRDNLTGEGGNHPIPAASRERFGTARRARRPRIAPRYTRGSSGQAFTSHKKWTAPASATR